MARWPRRASPAGRRRRSRRQLQRRVIPPRRGSDQQRGAMTSRHGERVPAAIGAGSYGARAATRASPRHHGVTRPTDFASDAGRRASCSPSPGSSAKASPVEIGVVPALLLEDVLPGRRLHHLVDQLGQRRRAVAAAMPGGAHHRAPVGDHEVDALLLEGRARRGRRRACRTVTPISAQLRPT